MLTRGPREHSPPQVTEHRGSRPLHPDPVGEANRGVLPWRSGSTEPTAADSAQGLQVSRRWTTADLQQLRARAVSWSGDVSTHEATTTAQVSKPTKYRNEKVVVDGIKFDSRLESRCYLEQKLRQAAGDLRYFLRQVPFPLEGGVVYRADFVCFPKAGHEEVIDATGRATPAKLNKLKQVKARYGVVVVLWSDKRAA